MYIGNMTAKALFSVTPDNIYHIIIEIDISLFVKSNFIISYNFIQD